jgi:sulfide:quinone oxidoreductase
MANITIIGAGVSGTSLALQLASGEASAHGITLIDHQTHWHFVPSHPWIVVGWRRSEQITVDLGPVLASRRITRVTGRVVRLFPEQKQLELADGRILGWDQLVIATGPVPDHDAIPGLGPARHSFSVLELEDALKARLAWDAFIDHPGDIITGAVQGASAFGPAYELALILDRDLRERHLRHRTRITFLTPEPWLGHLGIGGIADSREVLEGCFRERDIRWRVNTRVTRVWQHYVDVETRDASGRLVSRVSLRSDFTALLPAFRGFKAAHGIEGLADDRDFIIVDKHLRNPRYSHIWAIGAVVAQTLPDSACEIPGASITNARIEVMVDTLAHNLLDSLAGQAPTATATAPTLYMADMGTHGIAFIAMPEGYPRCMEKTRQGSQVHAAKVAFEQHFLDKMRRGTTEHVTRDTVLPLLGLTPALVMPLSDRSGNPVETCGKIQ